MVIHFVLRNFPRRRRIDHRHSPQGGASICGPSESGQQVATCGSGDPISMLIASRFEVTRRSALNQGKWPRDSPSEARTEPLHPHKHRPEH